MIRKHIIGPGRYVVTNGTDEVNIVRNMDLAGPDKWIAYAVWDRHLHTDPLPTLRDAAWNARGMLEDLELEEAERQEARLEQAEREREDAIQARERRHVVVNDGFGGVCTWCDREFRPQGAWDARGYNLAWANAKRHEASENRKARKESK